jgi:hypothetical protein
MESSSIRLRLRFGGENGLWASYDLWLTISMYMILTWVYIMESSSIRLRMFCIFLHSGLLFFLFANILLDLKSFYLTIGSSLDSIEVDLNCGDVEVLITQECILEHFAN